MLKAYEVMVLIYLFWSWRSILNSPANLRDVKPMLIYLRQWLNSKQTLGQRLALAGPNKTKPFSCLQINLNEWTDMFAFLHQWHFFGPCVVLFVRTGISSYTTRWPVMAQCRANDIMSVRASTDWRVVFAGKLHMNDVCAIKMVRMGRDYGDHGTAAVSWLA